MDSARRRNQPGRAASSASAELNTLISFNGRERGWPPSRPDSLRWLPERHDWQCGADNDGTVFSVPVTDAPPTTLAMFNFHQWRNRAAIESRKRCDQIIE
jgi:hypothetical protein